MSSCCVCWHRSTVIGAKTRSRHARREGATMAVIGRRARDSTGSSRIGVPFSSRTFAEQPQGVAGSRTPLHDCTGDSRLPDSGEEGTGFACPVRGAGASCCHRIIRQNVPIASRLAKEKTVHASAATPREAPSSARKRRVGAAHHWATPPSEPYVPLSRHTAQARTFWIAVSFVSTCVVFGSGYGFVTASTVCRIEHCCRLPPVLT